jgi:hypothetical protein
MYRSLFPVLLHASTVVADPAVSPEVEYTLQARVLLQDDNDARATLLAVSQDAVPEGTLDWDDVIDDLPAWLTREGIQPPSRAVMQEVSEALRIRLPRVTCTARDVVPLGSPEIAQYTLACMVPDVEPAFAAYRAMRSGDDADRDALSDAFFATFAARLRGDTAVAHLSTAVGWSSFRHGDVHAARAEHLYRTVLFGLLPFAEWDRRIASDAGRHGHEGPGD